MSDIFSIAKRSLIMSLIPSKNTRPELIVRKSLFRLGYRYRLHSRSLPGHPDVVLPKYKTVIFVHGCFWHSHQSCPRSGLPVTNRTFWKKKLNENKHRDRKHTRNLFKLGWKVVTVWQCETREPENLLKIIREIGRNE